MKLTDKQFEIMDVLWNSTAPMTVNDIINMSKNRSWSENSVYIMMKQLEEKGAVAVSHLEPTGTIHARAYKPELSFEEFMASVMASKSKARKTGAPLDVDKVIEAIRKVFDEMDNGM